MYKVTKITKLAREFDQQHYFIEAGGVAFEVAQITDGNSLYDGMFISHAHDIIELKLEDIIRHEVNIAREIDIFFAKQKTRN